MPRVLVRLLVVAVAFVPIVLTSQSGVSLANFTNFEGAQASPIRIGAGGARLFAVNTPDARLSVFDIATDPAHPALVAEIPVGLEPVSVNPRTDDEVWVVNQVSDSVSVVSVSRGIVIDTLHVGDEPADVVFAGDRAFVSVSRRNELRVFDATTRAGLAAIPLAGLNPRALAVSPDGGRVYVAFALSGNRTTIIPAAAAPPPPPPTNPALPAAPQTGLIVDATDPNFALPYTMPDNDVAEIDVASLAVTRYFSRVGTINLGIAVRPATGEIYVANTEARNLVRFETALRGHLVDNRITRIQIGPDGTTIAPIDLNPDIDYAVLPNPAAIAGAIAQPTALAFDATGDALYVAGFGTDRIAKVDASGTVVGRIDVSSGDPSSADPRNKRGPRGLAVNAASGHLYVLNRISNTISIVDTAASAVVAEIPAGAFDPTPPTIRAGRGFLYDARLSGNGTAACAACHLDSDMDLLAWDLGNPDGQMQTVNLLPMHPMKGPMTTQTLRGLSTLEPFHWRGDRADFLAFNPAFDRLMGGLQLSSADMAAYRDFIDTVRFQPNPNQNLDRTLPASFAGADPIAGRNTFLNEPFTAGVTCNMCHTANPGPGTNRTIIPAQILQESQSFKVPHLRNIYQKLDFTNAPGAKSLGGFGILHDGSDPDLFAFLSHPVFQSLSTDRVRQANISAFLQCFDTGTAPAVGYTITAQNTNVDAPDIATDWNTLESQAAAGNIDLVAKGTIDGEVRGLLYRPSSATYTTDRTGVGPFTQAQLRARIAAGDVLSLSGVPPGSGARIGIDRDLDGVLDGDVGAPPPPPPAPVLHVQDIVTTDAAGAPTTTFRQGQTVFWRVRIVDDGSLPAADVSVTTNTLLGGVVVSTAQAATGADGWALFSSPTSRSTPRGTYEIRVVGVAKDGTTYDPARDVKNSTTYTLRR